MYSFYILIPFVLFIVGLLILGNKERKEKAKLSLEDQGRLSIATSKAWFWRFLPLISIFACVQLFKLFPHYKDHLIVNSLATIVVLIVSIAVGTYFRLKGLSTEGVPVSYIQAVKTYAKVRLAMFLILPFLFFVIGILPLLWALLMNFFHPLCH